MSRDTLFTVIIFYSLVLFIPVSGLLLLMRPQLWHYLLAVFLGLIVGWFDLHTDEVSLTILLLVVLAMFLGFAKPKHAWRWALLLAVWVPLGGLAAGALGFKVVTPQPNWIPSLFAFVPALIGAYGGALVNWTRERLAFENSQQVKT
jgi:hypothetical protein